MFYILFSFSSFFSTTLLFPLRYHHWAPHLKFEKDRTNYCLANRAMLSSLDSAAFAAFSFAEVTTSIGYYFESFAWFQLLAYEMTLVILHNHRFYSC